MMSNKDRFQEFLEMAMPVYEQHQRMKPIWEQIDAAHRRGETYTVIADQLDAKQMWELRTSGYAIEFVVDDNDANAQPKFKIIWDW